MWADSRRPDSILRTDRPALRKAGECPSGGVRPAAGAGRRACSRAPDRECEGDFKRRGGFWDSGDAEAASGGGGGSGEEDGCGLAGGSERIRLGQFDGRGGGALQGFSGKGNIVIKKRGPVIHITGSFDHLTPLVFPFFQRPERIVM